MKKIIVIIIIVALVGVGVWYAFMGNRVGIFADIHNNANWAEVRHLNGIVKIYKVHTWSQDDEGYTLNLSNGDTMFVNGVNCILTKDKPDMPLVQIIE